MYVMPSRTTVASSLNPSFFQLLYFRVKVLAVVESMPVAAKTLLRLFFRSDAATFRTTVSATWKVPSMIADCGLVVRSSPSFLIVGASGPTTVTGVGVQVYEHWPLGVTPGPPVS